MTEPSIETREGRAALRDDRPDLMLQWDWLNEALDLLDARDAALEAGNAEIEYQERNNAETTKAFNRAMKEMQARIAALEARLAERDGP